MVDEREISESKDADIDATSTLGAMKTPPTYVSDSKNGSRSGDLTTKKKALPPPSTPPPKTRSSAAAFRSKSSLPLPAGPPPDAGAPSSSVAKIRAAARRPSSGPPPTMAQENADPLHGAQSKLMGSPMTMAKSHLVEALPVTAPPKTDSKAMSTPRDLNSERKGDTTDAPVHSFGSKCVSPMPSQYSSEATFQPNSATLDISANDLPIDTKAVELPAASMEPVTEKLLIVNPSLVMKNTKEVLNHTMAAYRKGLKVESGSTTLLAYTKENSGDILAKVERAAKFSSSQPRLNVPDDEVTVVRKQAFNANLAEAKTNSSVVPLTFQSIANLDDTFDDLEEIPFLEDEFLNEKENEAKHLEHCDDGDSIIDHPRISSTRSEHEDNYKSDAVARRNATHQDMYDDLRTMERGSRSPHNHECSGSEHDENEVSRSRSFLYDKRDNSIHSEANTSDRELREKSDRERDYNKEKTRENRKEKRRSKQDEPTKIQAQIYNPKNVPCISDHLLEFIKRPLECGRGHIVKCFIERNGSGPNKIAPIYTLLLEVDSSSGRPIMYARKNATSRITSHYVISLNKDDLILPRMMRSHQYVGKLRSSTNLMEYTLYGQGNNPDDLDTDSEIDEEVRLSIRAELALIRYHYSKKPYPRKMEVMLPAIQDNGQSYLEWRPLSRDQSMEEHVRTIVSAGGQNVVDASNFVFLHKRETKYDPLSSCIVDFRNRATCVSVKNFQLVHSEPTNEELCSRYRELYPNFVHKDQGPVSLPQEFVLLQLGKVGNDCFNMDFQYPLSMLQAFAISLTRFDTKQR